MPSTTTKSLEAMRSLLTELDCHTVFATALLGDPSTMPEVDLSALSEKIAMVGDGLNLLQSFVGTDEKGNWRKGEMAKAMVKLAMASSVERGKEIATTVSESWREADVATKKKRERDYLEALLADDGGVESDVKKVKVNAEKMADEILTNGEVSEEVFTVFYGKLKSIKEYHSKLGGGAALFAMVDEDGPSDGLEMLNAMSGKSQKRKGRPDVDGFDLTALVSASITPPSSSSMGRGAKRLFNFSGEEVFGKYLDLTDSHLEVLNILSVFSNPVEKGKTLTPVGYSQYLNMLLNSSANDVTLNLPGGVAEKINHRKKYIKWLKNLHDYLEAFLARTTPLLDLEVEVKQAAEKELDRVWGEGEAKKWGVDEAVEVEMEESFDVEKFETAKDLAEKLGGDGLKARLNKLGLKSGGDVKQRSERLFALKGKKLEDLPKKFFAKGGGPKTGGEEKERGPQNKKEIALLEAITVGFLVQLRPVLDATASRAERRLTQTTMERRRERDEEISGSLREIKASTGDFEDSDSEDEEIYNPKNLPLGWDGKPIPVWLYKLHGLNQYFSCEICGNESYRGARAYEKHFTEAKHSHGMKCLGIPNSKHFHGVTKIADAKKLWETIKAKSDASAPVPGSGGGGLEEFEDSHGNVLSRAAYEDLARQGLL
ncbi:hypothetical protein TL16_g04690 [Triparma laevis f. inornata]|uniref:Matrin-type domain-containing protein n=1 Tax=Triparma laevis f. inornata TaxID=1714386 RepID=A0A9W7E6M1_9STRA|nr:hypothetical protein TL16_g04690 [Triparma laevis f. inornata]